jgi:hypothetical protein
MARRYGREGLHIIIAGSLDSSSALRQRVKAANYGIGLRTGQAINTLGVIQTPPALRSSKELPTGRGFIVKSGHATLLQVATPFEGMGVTMTGELEEDEERMAQVLDIWVSKICEKHPQEKIQWSQPISSNGAQGINYSTDNKKLMKMFALVQNAMQKELENLGEHNGAEELITAKLLQMDFQSWNNEAEIERLLKEIYVKNHPDPSYSASMLEVLDTESLMLEIEGLLK